MTLGNYEHTDQLNYFSVAWYLNPFFHKILKDISEGKKDLFLASLSFINQFPFNKKDLSYQGKVREDYHNNIIQPYDLLDFSVQHCALHNLDFNKFFQYFEMIIQNNQFLIIELIFILLFFLLDLLLKCILLGKSFVYNDSFKVLIKSLPNE